MNSPTSDSLKPEPYRLPVSISSVGLVLILADSLSGRFVPHSPVHAGGLLEIYGFRGSGSSTLHVLTSSFFFLSLFVLDGIPVEIFAPLLLTLHCLGYQIPGLEARSQIGICCTSLRFKRRTGR